MANIISFDKRPVTSLIDLWQSYCSDRGLTPEVLAPLNGELLTLEAAAKNTPLGSGMYGFKGDGGLGAFVFQIAPDEYQARILYDPNWEPPTPKPGEQVAKRKRVKYYRPRGSANVLFMPPNLNDWWDLNSNFDLLIVEGALNALRLASDGYHAVAITGVQNYRTGGKGTPIITNLSKLVQARNVNRVTVLFDSDAADPLVKPELWNGLHGLTQEFMKLRQDRSDTIFHCFPHAKVNGDKNGPDDYLHARGIPEFNRLLREESVRYTDNPYLQLERKCLVRFIHDEISGHFFDCNNRQLIRDNHCNNIILTMGGRVDDILSPRHSKVNYDTKRLLTAPGLRISTGGMRYQPDTEEMFFSDSEAATYINTFNPRDVPAPVKGDISIYHEMMSSLCRDSPSAKPLIETILAHHAQYPATTPKYGILFTGEQGSGKSNMAKLLGTSLGKFHSSRVDLGLSFNSNWRGHAAKEWPEFDPKMDPEWLKDLITNVKYEVNTKFGALFIEYNFTLNMFTCNGIKSKIQENDRRFVITGYGRSDNKRLGLEFERWVNGPGPSLIRWYFLNEVDASHYDTLDVRTEMRDTVIESSKTNREMIKDEIVELLSQYKELSCVPNQVLAALLEPYGRAVNIHSFSRDFGHVFIKPAIESVSINDHVHRFRAFRDHAFWRKCTNTDEYRKQYELSQKVLQDIIKKGKF